MDELTAPDQPDTTVPVDDGNPWAKRSLIIGALGVLALLVLGIGLALGTRAKDSTATVSLAGVTNGTTADGKKADPTKPGLGGAIPNGTDAAGQPILLDGESTTTTTIVVPTTPKPTTPPTTAPKAPPTTAPVDTVSTPPTTPPTTKPTTTTSTTDPHAVRIAWYKQTTTPTCAQPNPSYDVTLTWSAPNATKVTVSIDGPGIFDTYAANFTQAFPFACGGQAHASHTYLLTAFGADGKTVTQTIKISA